MLNKHSFNQASSHKKDHLSTSEVKNDQQLIEQIVASLLPELTDQLSDQLIDQLQQALTQAIILGQSLNNPAIEKIQQDVQKLLQNTKQCIDHSVKTEQMLLEFKKEEEQRDLAEEKRDQLLYRRVGFIQKVVLFTKRQVTEMLPLVKNIHLNVKRTIQLLISGTFLSDMIMDVTKEVCKEAIVKEIETVSNHVRQILKPFLEPILGPIWEVVSPIYSSIPLKIKATIALLLIVAMIFDHAGSVWLASRRGSEKK